MDFNRLEVGGIIFFVMLLVVLIAANAMDNAVCKEKDHDVITIDHNRDVCVDDEGRLYVPTNKRDNE